MAYMYNADGGVVKTDNIRINNNNIVITNWGKITTNILDGNGNQGTLNNGCNLVVKEKFEIHDLNLAANSVISSKIMDFEGFVTLRENSILRCDDLSLNLTDIQYCGAANQSALVSALNLGFLNTGNNDAAFAIRGNIWLEINTYIPDNYYDVNYVHVCLDTAVKKYGCLGLSKVGEANIVIPKGDCTGEGNTPINHALAPIETPQSWILACEDLGSTGDFDFNDVVVSVSHVSGETKATVTPLAAGGVYSAKIGFIGSDGLKYDYGEIHELFGYPNDDGKQKMINTGETENGLNGLTCSPISIKVPKDFTLSYDNRTETNMGGFFIQVLSNMTDMTTIVGSKRGKAPQMILVPGDWRWPKEYCNIEKVYPQFKAWSENMSSNPDWFYYPAEDAQDKLY